LFKIADQRLEMRPGVSAVVVPASVNIGPLILRVRDLLLDFPADGWVPEFDSKFELNQEVLRGNLGTVVGIESTRVTQGRYLTIGLEFIKFDRKPESASFTLWGFIHPTDLSISTGGWGTVACTGLLFSPHEFKGYGMPLQFKKETSSDHTLNVLSTPEGTWCWEGGIVEFRRNHNNHVMMHFADVPAINCTERCDICSCEIAHYCMNSRIHDTVLLQCMHCASLLDSLYYPVAKQGQPCEIRGGKEWVVFLGELVIVPPTCTALEVADLIEPGMKIVRRPISLLKW